MKHNGTVADPKDRLIILVIIGSSTGKWLFRICIGMGSRMEVLESDEMIFLTSSSEAGVKDVRWASSRTRPVSTGKFSLPLSAPHDHFE